VEHFDAIVVGGGPAGSTTASFLARMGHRVVLLEKERFPRHRIGESMIAATIDVLAELGLEDTLASAGFPVKSGGCFIWGRSQTPWCIRFDEVPGRPTSYQVKRDVFDQLLLRHSAALGVDVREGHRVTGVVREGARIAGVRVEAPGGTHELRAHYTVDASGLSGIIGRETTSRVAVDELDNQALYGYWRGPHPPPAALGGEIRETDRNNIIVKWVGPGWLWFIPLGHGELLSVGYVVPRAALPAGADRARLESILLEKVSATPELRYLLSHARYTGEFHTVRDWSYRRGAMTGPGHFAVGDAACFVDPILSSGVYLAVLHARMCAIAINTALRAPGREALGREWYETLYGDAFDDYLQMARYWYAGSGGADAWMERAREVTPGATSYTESDRASFIGLATGNTHAHANYVSVARMESLGCPARLTKDARSRFHRDAQAILQRHAAEDSRASSREISARNERAMSLPRGRKAQLQSLLARHAAPKPRFSAPIDGTRVDDAQALVLADGARVSVEVIDDLVTVIVTDRSGERRRLDDEEQALLRGLVQGQPAGRLIGASARPDAARAFVLELLAARVAAPV
jgi:halogenation protein CepH